MKYLVYTIACILFVSSSCKKRSQTASKEMSLNAFDTLILKSVFELHLLQSNENKIRIEAPSNIIEKIEINQTNNSISIKNTNKINWLNPENNTIKLYLKSSQLKHINASETCNVKTDNTWTGYELGIVMASKLNEATLDVNCNTFYYWNNFPCGGKLQLSGTCSELKLWNVALMQIDAETLYSTNALVFNASKGDCKINCSQKLVYKITGSGNIYVSGKPTTVEKIEESATGKLILR
jgi:Putative auto-transporter adhesin, head GIN domain